MKHRTTVLEQFSTVALWKEEQWHGWQKVTQLQLSIEQYLQQDDSLTSERYWTVFWHQRWLEQKDNKAAQQLARLHLYAYLQESCYQAALKIWQSYRQRFDYSIEDYFGLGKLKFEKVLSDFNANLNPSLGGYCLLILEWRIIDELRQFNKTFGHTIWSLLLNSTEMRLKKALLQSGIVAQSVDYYLHIWDCYKAIYQSAKIKQDGKVQEPSSEQWQQINDLWHTGNIKWQQRTQIRELLINMGNALLQYLSPTSISLNLTMGEDIELIDSVTDKYILNTLEEEEEQAQRQKQFQKIYSWLREQLETLDIQQYHLNPQINSILVMYYGQDLKQIPIAQQLNINQSTVARNITKVQEILAEKFIQWSINNLDYSMLSTDAQLIGTALHQWLKYHYQKNIKLGKDKP
jgi:RNA polymerase sigma factor (sigma-70 family)